MEKAKWISYKPSHYANRCAIVIYEARPNVTSDVSVLSFKSGNAAILRGGKEAFRSNIAISNLFRASLKKIRLIRIVYN